MRTKTCNAKLFRSLGLSTSLAMVISTATLTVGAEPSPTTGFEKFGQDVKNAIGSSSLSVDVPILNFDFFKGMNIDMPAEPEIDQSYIKNFYTQSKKGYFAVGGLAGFNKPFELAKGALHMGAAPNYMVEANLARQFCTRGDAVQDAIEYKNLNMLPFLPLDSKRALTLKAGDYFSMKTKAGFMAGGSFLQSLIPSQLFNISLNYFVSGSFQIHVLRLPNDKMRIKIVSLGDRHFGASTGVGFVGALKVFSVKLIDKGATRILDMSPVRLNYDFKGKSNLLMAEYEINLLNLDAHPVYDQMWNRALALTRKITKDLLKLKIGNSRERIEEAVLLNLEPLDEVARADLDKPIYARRMTRNFKDTLESDYSRPWTFRLGFGLVYGKRESRNSTNEIVSIQGHDSPVTYQFVSSLRRKDDAILKSLWQRVQSDVVMNSVLRQDPISKQWLPEDFVFHIKNRQLRVEGFETDQTKEQLNWYFPKLIYNQIDFSRLRTGLETRKKTYQEIQVVLHSEVLNALPDLNENDVDEIAQRYQDYLDALPNILKTLYPKNAAQEAWYVADAPGRRGPGYYPKKYAKNLAIFLDKRKSAADRYRGLMELQNESFFIRTGIGFILALLPQDLGSLQKLVHVKVLMDSKKSDTVSLEFGDQPVSAIYDRILTIQNLVENGALDLRLEGESLVNAIDCHRFIKRDSVVSAK